MKSVNPVFTTTRGVCCHGALPPSKRCFRSHKANPEESECSLAWSFQSLFWSNGRQRTFPAFVSLFSTRSGTVAVLAIMSSSCSPTVGGLRPSSPSSTWQQRLSLQRHSLTMNVPIAPDWQLECEYAQMTRVHSLICST